MVMVMALASAFAIFIPQSLFASVPSHFLWSDSKGLMTVEATCQLRHEEQNPFFISQKPNSQLNDYSKLKGLGFFGGWVSGKLLDRSLITAKEAPNAADDSQIRVLSVAKNATRPDVLHISEAGDEGYLAKESLQDIGNFVIEIKDAPAFLNLKSPFRIQKSFWQAATEDEKFLAFTCGDIAAPVRYFLFEVYDLAHLDPVAQVGVNLAETKIWDSINVYTPEEANQVVKEEAEHTPPAPQPPTEVPLPSPQPPSEGQEDTPILEGELEYVICTEDKTTGIFAQDLKTKIFSANQFETVIPSQSWDEKRKTTHVEVQFPAREEMPRSGWIPRDLVQLRAECIPLKKTAPSDEDAPVDDSLTTLDPRVSRKDCCKFPTTQRSSQPYTSGILQFRAKRNKGKRRHAGCDLYRSKGEAAVAVASGTVLRGLYYFYQGVFAIEVKHPKFIARYGEVLGKYGPGVAKGKNVVAGQELGYIGKVNSGCCAPMLHFEMYKGSAHGPLTRHRVPPYDRRSDVMNPTDFLKQWEKVQFGQSY
ncbi:MAG TPA: M23 family metallopeptidase [Pseudobdellovibrionaceae bacterium]|jgi:murein DD-endopeptidase MepM/ murein hydrolase activator NlpD